MLGAILIGITVAIAIWYFLIWPHSYWTRRGVKQSKPWILFGDAWYNFLKQYSLYDVMTIWYSMFPNARYNGIYSFNTPTLVVRDPELIKHITVKDFEHFTDHQPFVDPESDPLWSSAIFFLRGDRWKEMRNTLSPTFTSSKIKNISVLMLETAENFVNHFLDNEDDIIEVELKDSFTRFANDIIATTAFGVKVDSLKEQTNSFYAMGKRLTQFKGIVVTIRFIAHFAFPKLCKYLGVPFIDRKASLYFNNVIEETIKLRQDQDFTRLDMINLMLEARKEDTDTKGLAANKSKVPIKITNQEISSQAMLFFFAGFETISTAMCFGTYELALNKDIQDTLRQEIMETQKGGKVTYDDLMKMKYMDMVISEMLRKWPPTPNLDRLCTKPYTIQPVNEDEVPVTILKDQLIILPHYALHHDPKYFPNPEKFDPERFSEENKHNIVPYTYMPFGVGPRMCIGNRFALVEIKALLFNLLLNFEVVPTEKTAIPLVLPKAFHLIPDGGIWLGLKRIRN